MTRCEEACGCAAAQGPPADSAAPLAGNAPAVASLFSIPKMDCPAEERLIRLALEGAAGLAALELDLRQRELRVLHDGPVDDIAIRLGRLGLGARLVSTVATAPTDRVASAPDAARGADEARVLGWLLAINAVMFVLEIGAGWLAQSTGLIADSLDMLADAAVYGLALYAVGRAAGHQVRAAHLSGWLQLAVALGAMAEVARRLVFGSEPEPPLMIGVAAAALAANLACVWLLARHRDRGAHMKASWIFSTNDVLANLGVIVAGMLVAWTGANTPDLVVGAVISVLVLNGARRILKLRG